jgi:hypothetical protein
MLDEAAFLASNKVLDWVALNEHLAEVRPIFDAFCTRNRFAYVNRLSLGRYPRMRIERTGATNIWFDLSMDLDKDGTRFEQFRRDLPYELSGGAYIDVPDGSKYGTRFSEIILCFSGKPFDEVGAVLETEMEEHLPTLEGMGRAYLTDNGQRILLGR